MKLINIAHGFVIILYMIPVASFADKATERFLKPKYSANSDKEISASSSKNEARGLVEAGVTHTDWGKVGGPTGI
jgi:hypothetical protein